MDTHRKQWAAPEKYVLALIVVLGLSMPIGRTIFAQQKAGPCADDVARFCKDVQPGKGSVAKCLKEHENELSPACKEKIAQRKEQRQEAVQACHDDVLNFCKDIKPGGGNIATCLKEHENELSPACKDRISQMKERKQ